MSPPIATQPAVSVATSIELAERTGTRIEVEALRTETSQTFANPSGTLTLEQGLQPVRVRAGASWAAIDTTLERKPDGRVGPKVAARPMTFSGGGDGPMIEVGADQASIALDAPFPLPVPELDGATATYRDVLPDVDLRLTADPESFRQVLVVKTAAAAQQEALTSLTFPAHVVGARLQEAAGGGLAVVSPMGETLLQSSEPVMWDSRAAVRTSVASRRLGSAAGAPEETAPPVPVQPSDGAPLAVDGPTDDSRVAQIDAQMVGGSVSLVPDQKLLQGEDTTYPVYIDPSLSGGRHSWTMVNQSYPTTEYWKFSGNEGVGHNSTLGVVKKRLFYQFTTSGVNGKSIVRADFRAMETFAYSCTRSVVQAYRTGPISSSTNWNNQPAAAKLQDEINAAHGRTGCDPGGKELEFTVTEAVAFSAKAKSTYTTIGLRAEDETSNSGWKRFDQTATLQIEYNSLPATPTSLRTTSPSTKCLTGSGRPVVPGADPPIITARLNDADGAKGQKVTARFELWRSGATAGSFFYADGPKLPGVDYSRQLPTLADGTWKWRVRAYDGLVYSGWAGWCEFTVDSSKPPTPTITAASGNVYAVGTAVSFTFGTGGAIDVDSYRWALNSDAPTSAAVPAATPSLRVTSTHFGPSTLKVWSYDRAGNRSTASGEMSFTVTGGSATHLWRLDETTGTTAANTVTTANPLTVGAGTSWGTGYLADADPTDRALTMPAGSASSLSTATGSVDVAANWSAALWVKPSSLTSRRTLISEDAGTGSAFTVGIVPSGTVGANLVTDDSDEPVAAVCETACFAVTVDNPGTGASVTVLDPNPVQVNEWAHVAIGYQAGTDELALYVGGESVGSANLPYTPTSVTGRFRVGAETVASVAASPFVGVIDEVSTYRGVLSAEQVAVLALPVRP